MKTHISLTVSNLKKSLDFYTKMLGVEPAKVKSDYAKFDVSNPPLNLSVNKGSFEKGGSLSHLGLQVSSTEDVIAISNRWAESGLRTVGEMQTDCCYALQDKVWVSDPDGNHWEVFTVLGDTGGPGKEASACCSPDVEAGEVAAEGSACC